VTTNPAVPAATGEQMIALSKKYTLYEWSAQSTVDPIAVAQAQDIQFWTSEGQSFKHATPLRSNRRQRPPSNSGVAAIRQIAQADPMGARRHRSGICVLESSDTLRCGCSLQTVSWRGIENRRHNPRDQGHDHSRLRRWPQAQES
jgi:hypothetical protein